MTWRLVYAGLLAAMLQADVAASTSQPVAAAAANAASASPAVGASQAAIAAAATPAGVEATYRRQRQLCQPLLVAAVRTECLRQADRSRAQSLAQLVPPASAAAASAASAASDARGR